MAITLNKILSLLVAIGYAVTAGVLSMSVGSALLVFAVCLLPLALIWFPEKLGTTWPAKKTILGNNEDQVGRGGTYRDSPPRLVVFVGWFFLVGLPVIVYLISR